jgi:hypothetical protein
LSEKLAFSCLRILRGWTAIATTSEGVIGFAAHLGSVPVGKRDPQQLATKYANQLGSFDPDLDSVAMDLLDHDDDVP